MKIGKLMGLFLLLLAAVLIMGSETPVLAASISAKTITLSKTEGSNVTVKSGSGRTLPVREKMTIYNGYTVISGEDSYAYLLLDNTKAIKLDENTSVNIKKEGNKNEIALINGSLFLNVTEKLAQNETLNIKTSNTTMGIRGTIVIIGFIEDYNTSDSRQLQPKTVIKVLEGVVDVTGKEGVTSNRESEFMSATIDSIKYVSAGESFTMRLDNADKTSLNLSDIPSFAVNEIANDADTMHRTEEALKGAGVIQNDEKNDWKLLEEENRRNEENNDNATIQKRQEIIKNIPKEAKRTISPDDGIKPVFEEGKDIPSIPVTIQSPVTQDPGTTDSSNQYLPQPAGKKTPICNYTPEIVAVKGGCFTVTTDISDIMGRSILSSHPTASGYYEGPVEFEAVRKGYYGFQRDETNYNHFTVASKVLFITSDEENALRTVMFKDIKQQSIELEKIELESIPSDSYKIQYACVEYNDNIGDASYKWQESTLFEGLKPDTLYSCSVKLSVVNSSGHTLLEATYLKSYYTRDTDNKMRIIPSVATNPISIDSPDSFSYYQTNIPDVYCRTHLPSNAPYGRNMVKSDEDVFTKKTGEEFSKDTSGIYKAVPFEVEYICISTEDKNKLSTVTIENMTSTSVTLKPTVLDSIPKDSYSIEYFYRVTGDNSTYFDSKTNIITGLDYRNQYDIYCIIIIKESKGNTIRYRCSSIGCQLPDPSGKYTPIINNRMMFVEENGYLMTGGNVNKDHFNMRSLEKVTDKVGRHTKNVTFSVYGNFKNNDNIDELVSIQDYNTVTINCTYIVLPTGFIDNANNKNITSTQDTITHDPITLPEELKDVCTIKYRCETTDTYVLSVFKDNNVFNNLNPNTLYYVGYAVFTEYEGRTTWITYRIGRNILTKYTPIYNDTNTIVINNSDELGDMIFKTDKEGIFGRIVSGSAITGNYYHGEVTLEPVVKNKNGSYSKTDDYYNFKTNLTIFKLTYEEEKSFKNLEFEKQTKDSITVRCPYVLDELTGIFEERGYKCMLYYGCSEDDFFDNSEWQEKNVFNLPTTDKVYNFKIKLSLKVNDNEAGTYISSSTKSKKTPVYNSGIELPWYYTIGGNMPTQPVETYNDETKCKIDVQAVGIDIKESGVYERTLTFELVDGDGRQIPEDKTEYCTSFDATVILIVLTQNDAKAFGNIEIKATTTGVSGTAISLHIKPDVGFGENGSYKIEYMYSKDSSTSSDEISESPVPDKWCQYPIGTEAVTIDWDFNYLYITYRIVYMMGDKRCGSVQYGEIKKCDL